MCKVGHEYSLSSLSSLHTKKVYIPFNWITFPPYGIEKISVTEFQKGSAQSIGSIARA